VQFAFNPPLVNRDGKDFTDEPPFSTGIAVFAPGESRVIEFDDFYRYQDEAGLPQWAIPMGIPVNSVPVAFQLTITLRDPLGDNQLYRTDYPLSLRDLMTYTMRDTLIEDTAPETTNT
jgi:hypothetical protein